jgi:hypothetical protein
VLGGGGDGGPKQVLPLPIFGGWGGEGQGGGKFFHLAGPQGRGMLCARCAGDKPDQQQRGEGGGVLNERGWWWCGVERELKEGGGGRRRLQALPVDRSAVRDSL